MLTYEKYLLRYYLDSYVHVNTKMLFIENAINLKEI